MRCDYCGGSTAVHKGDYPVETINLGTITVPGISYERCENCSERYLPAGETEKIDAYLDAAEADAISELRIGDFISLNEAAEVLNITKQAFSKNKRIARGFVYSTMKGGRRLYYKPSVQAFKDSNDGRIALPRPPAWTTRETSNFFYDYIESLHKQPLSADSTRIRSAARTYGFFASATKADRLKVFTTKRKKALSTIDSYALRTGPVTITKHGEVTQTPIVELDFVETPTQLSGPATFGCKSKALH